MLEIYLPIAQVNIDIFLLFFLSLAVGVLSGLFGVGGGFLMTPFLIFILSGVYIFILYKSYLIGYDFDVNFTLYLGLNDLSRLFEDHLYIMIFWTHFIAINLFIGGWIVKDSQKFLINKILLAIPLIVTYLIGPIGLFLYWIIRIFYAKRISLYE